MLHPQPPLTSGPFAYMAAMRLCKLALQSARVQLPLPAGYPSQPRRLACAFPRSWPRHRAAGAGLGCGAAAMWGTRHPSTGQHRGRCSPCRCSLSGAGSLPSLVLRWLSQEGARIRGDSLCQSTWPHIFTPHSRARKDMWF